MKQEFTQNIIEEPAENLVDEANQELIGDITAFVDQAGIEDSETLKEQLQEVINNRLGDESLLNEIARVVIEKVSAPDIARSLIMNITDRILEDDQLDEYQPVEEQYLNQA